MPKIWLHEHVHIDNLRNLQGWEVRRNSNAYDVVHAFNHLYIREQWMETANVLHCAGHVIHHKSRGVRCGGAQTRAYLIIIGVILGAQPTEQFALGAGRILSTSAGMRQERATGVRNKEVLHQ